MRKIILAGAAMAVFGAGTAMAADALPPIVEAPYIEAPVSHPVAAAGGWYLRGDVGYSWNKIRGANFFQGGNATYAPFTTTSLRSSYSVGGGVGYQITSHLRTDVTLDYFSKADFRGSTTGGCGVLPAGPCVSTDISSVSGLSLLANAYVDFGTYGRFTPYAGVGIGGTHVNWKSLSNTSCSSRQPGIVRSDGYPWRRKVLALHLRAYGRRLG